MSLTQFLKPENIRQGVFLSSKKRALELVGKIISDALNHQLAFDDQHAPFCPVECFSSLIKREKLGSTCINNGIALPHAKLPALPDFTLTEPIAVFLQLETPIDYDAADHKEVDLIYAVMFPQESCETHRGCLQKIAQLLSDKNIAKQLRSATSVDEIWQILRYADTHISGE